VRESESEEGGSEGREREKTNRQRETGRER
jgi:hypothetical protein